MSASLRTLVLLAGLALAVPAGAVAADGEDSRALRQISVEAGQAPQQASPNAAKLGAEPTSAGSEPAHVAISLGDSRI
jgi:hypothetical protein